MKNNNKWIVVTNKLTYLLLLTIPVGIIKIIVYDLSKDNITLNIFVSILIILIGIYLFVRFNTYSHWYNPNHPKSNKKD